MADIVPVDVVVVNWNSGCRLKVCINSVLEFNCCNVVVFDNASIDGSEKIIHNLPNVMLVNSSVNFGFGKACNLGAQHANSEYLLFLNPDAAVYPGTLDKALAFIFI